MSGIAPALELERLTRRWPGREPVFEGLSLQVPRNRVCCLLGPSGCGKSTLLRCAASLDLPEKGRVYADGLPVHGPSPDRQLILQSDGQLFPWLSVSDNVSFPLRMNRAAFSDPADPEEMLELVGLKDSGNLYPSQLSGGMRQRVILARALVTRPSILLMDEPFAALDAEIRGRLHQLLHGILEFRRLTILLVTHDTHEALTLADSIHFMDSRGRLSGGESNPLEDSRDPERVEFLDAVVRIRRRYRLLMEPEDPQLPVTAPR